MCNLMTDEWIASVTALVNMGRYLLIHTYTRQLLYERRALLKRIAALEAEITRLRTLPAHVRAAVTRPVYPVDLDD